MDADLLGREMITEGLLRTLVRVVLAVIVLAIFFYSTTIAMSIIYPLDEAILGF
jgi:hypothetical protein